VFLISLISKHDRMAFFKLELFTALVDLFSIRLLALSERATGTAVSFVCFYHLTIQSKLRCHAVSSATSRIDLYLDLI
jgi:hypothetical protein